MATKNPFSESPFDQFTVEPVAEKAPRPEITAPTIRAKPVKAVSGDYEPLFEKYGQEYGVPPALLRTIAMKESRLNPNAVGETNQNGTTDYGLMQHNSRYHKERGITDWRDPEQSVKAAAALLKANLAQSNGDWRQAVRRYNGSGPKAEAYADDVMAKFNGQAGAQKPQSIDDQFSDTPVEPKARAFTADDFSDEPVLKEAAPVDQASVDSQPYFDRLKNETVQGFGDMQQSLTTARWAVGGQDSEALAEQLAKTFQERAAQPKTTAAKEIDAAYKGVSDASGVIDTTVAGGKALLTSLANPKETSIEIARSAANSLPTLAAGAAGAGGGALAGSVIPGAGTAIGAIAGGRAGMALGTTATELGAEVQDMVQKRLASGNQAPTAQNVLAILNDKGFQSEARNQGLKKGLTVAAVDQLFMGIGGKIATAPARKVATKELADAGVDVSNSAARKAALASPAGAAALEAAKPALAARVGAGAAAVGVDAAGESLGEGLSQQVARGEVDYGDALREGVTSIGQSVAQTGAGVAIEQAKTAARAAIVTAPNAPSTAPGPLQRATENAAAAPDRATVTTPQGSVTGTVSGTSADDKVEIVGDDGEVFTFQTGAEGITITPEAPNTPLTNALEEASANTETPAEPAGIQAPDQAATPGIAAAPAPQGMAEPGAPVEQPEPQQQQALSQPAAPDLTTMDEPALRERLKFITGQAKSTGWDARLITARREVEKQINTRFPKPTTPAPVQETMDLAPVSPTTEKSNEETAEAEQTAPEQPAETAAPAVENTENAPSPTSNENKDLGATEGSLPLPLTKPAKTAKKAGPASLGSQKADMDHLFGIDDKRKKAIDRIAAGKAWFNDGVKAKDFIAKNGLKDTHEAKQGKGGRFDVVAKEAKPDRQYDVVAINEKTGAKTVMTKEPVPHKEAVTIKSKISDNPARRIQLEESNGTDNSPSGQPAIAEEVVAAKETPAPAPVQPDAAEEVNGKPVVSANKVFTEDAAAKARALLKSKLGNLNSGVDPETMQAGIMLAGYHIEKGARTFAAYSKAMLEDLGDVVKPYLKSWYMGVKYDPRATGFDGMSSAAEVEAEDVLSFKAESLESSADRSGGDAKPVSNVGKADASAVEGKGGINIPSNEATGSEPKSTTSESSPNVSGVSADLGGDFFKSQPGVVQGFSKLDVPSQRMVLARVFSSLQNRQVLDSVISLLPVQMVDVLSGQELPTKVAFSDPSVLKHLLSVSDGASSIPISTEAASTLVKATARVVAKLESRGGLGSNPKSNSPAMGAGEPSPALQAEGRPANAATADRAGILSFLDSSWGSVEFSATVGARGVGRSIVHNEGESTTNDAKNYLENANEPSKLDQPGARKLEGQQPDLLQGTEPSGQTGDGAEGSGGTDSRGNVGTGGSRVQQPGSVGDDAREVSVPASGVGAGRGGKPGSQPVQRGKRAAKPDTAIERGTGNQPDLIPESGTRAQDRADGFVITDEDAIGEGGAKTKFKQNVAAIRLLKELTAANRQATRAEQAVLAKYVGWGGIPQAFYRDNNEVSKGWEKEAAELKALMTDAEMSAAASSTRNAHYTSTEIVTGVWAALRQFGFRGGRGLEPSVGVGNFFGLMPTDLRSASALTGVELDHITGGIAKQLYPQANVQAPVGFQDFSVPDGYFDVAFGNPPFGREGIYDAIRRKISGFSIHNYFFAKSVDALRPNGVLAMVVTNRLLDSAGDKARQYIAAKTEFIGAIRLPNDAFAKNAGTQVTTDIIFLRKLKDGEQPTGHKWMEVKQYKDANGKLVPLNEYFVANPDMMLGDFGMYGSMYSPEDSALVAKPGQDTPALMQAAIAKLPQGFMDGPTAAPTFETIEPLNDISRVKVGSVFEQDGQIFERREDMIGKQQAAPVVFPSDKAKERVTGMIRVRDALINVRGLQLQENMPEATLAAARDELNKVYDAFVKTNGPLNIEANKRLMRDDPTWPQIAALEDNFDKGITPAIAKKTGEKAREPSARKSAIFSRRTQSPYKAPETAKSAKDAMVSSMAERGRVDLDYMASLYAGHTQEAIAKELDGLIFKNPSGGWESRDQYLSGNVKKKLAQAIEALKTDTAMRGNVEALKAVQPADIEAVDIDVKAGAHWVPADVMQDFIQTVSGGERAKALYNPVTASWTLSVERATAANVAEYSTDRATLTNVLEAAANQKQIVIRDKQYDGSTVLNEAATTAANAKVEKIKAEWKNWLWTDDARRERLARIYNDTFNTDVQREFDGSHLTFPGKVGDDIIQLRPHQSNAVWRMVQSGTTLLDHVVGAGKTFTMISGIMEMRRMGQAKKPMLVVPNHLVGQWAEDFMKLYPGANILAATKKDFEKENRKKLFARIATGDWDAVIVAHSSFGKVEVEPEFQSAFIKQQIADMDVSIGAMRAAEGKSSRNVKQIEKQKAALEEKLKKLFDTGTKDDNLYFSELGVDAVLLDEAHEFKNLGFSTGMQRVAGLGNPAGSNKAADMFMKIQATLDRTGGKNVVFATGTPISNTMAEMYTMQRFLDYGTLKDQGIAHFDAWAKTFGEVVTDWELSPSGQYKMNSRFAKFVNMPELMMRYQSFADVVNRDDINRMLAVQGKTLPVPKVATGKPENTVVDRSGDQAQYIGIPTVDDNGAESYPEGSLIWRSENLPKKAEKGADNMLKIMSDARKAALDMRLIDPNYSDNPASKVNVAVSNIKSIYDKWNGKKGVQLVFCDLSTPKAAVAKEAAELRELVALAENGDDAAQEKLDAMSPDELLALDSKFSVYDDLKAKLIASGIPENEVAFIHDASTEIQKQELFAKVKTGRIRVLLGSTAKMGAGMNVQDRLVALHHMDAPWRPSDLEQREGRIIRQGNLFEPMTKSPEAVPGFEIRILRYATKQTLDSRMWQTIEAKARFIEQVRKGTGAREVEDVAGEAANSAEMKAASSGNPLILEEMSLRQSIRKLENQKSEHDREQYRIKDRIRWAGDFAAKSDKQAKALEADAPLAPKEFAVKIGNQTFDKHGEAGEAILAAVDAMFDAGVDTREIGSYGGFVMHVDDASTNLLGKRAVLTLIGTGEYQIEANPGSSNTGLGLRLQNTVKSLSAEAEQARKAADRERAEVPKLQDKVKPWGGAAELADSKVKHAEIIEQLKPKKKPEAAKPEEGDAAAFSRSGGAVAPVSREPATTPAYEAIRQLSRFDDSFQLKDSGSTDLADIAKDMQTGLPGEYVNFEAGASSAVGKKGRQPTIALYTKAKDGSQTKLLDIFDSKTDKPYVVIGNSDVGQGVGGSLAYQIAFAWAHNNGKTMRPDPAGLTQINRLRRTMAMISSAYRFGTTKHLEPHQDQYIGLTKQAQQTKAEPEDTSFGGHPERYAELEALKANNWKSGDDSASIATNVQNLLTAAYQLAAIREPELRRLEVKDGDVRIRGDVETSIPLADGQSDPDAKDILGISLRPGITGVGKSTAKLLATAASVQRAINSDIGKRVRVGAANGENSGLGNAQINALQAIRSVLGDMVGGPNQGLAKTLYKRGDTPGAQSVETVERLATGIAARWANPPKIVVAQDMNDPRIPADVRAEDQKQRSGGATGEPEGFYYRGTVYLIADQLKTPEDTVTVLFHEALGHFGLRGLFGKELTPILQQIVNSRRSEVMARKGLEPLVAAEEILAELAQTNPELGFVKRAVATIRSWLRANVPGFKDMAMSDAEIIQKFIIPARAFVTQGQKAGADMAGVAFSRSQAVEKEGLTPPEQGLLRKIQAEIQDKNNRVKQIQDRIVEIAGAKVPEYADYAMAEENRPGRTAAKLQDFRANMQAPLVQRIAKSGHKLEQVEELAHAMHALERNRTIAKINPKHDPDSPSFVGIEGSGMSSEKAADIMGKYGNDKAIQRHVEDLQKIARATLDLKLETGRITQERYDAYISAWDFYVPLKGDEEYGPNIKSAMGHQERDEHIIENVMRDYEQSVVTGEINLARQVFLQMVLRNPDSNLWTVGVAPKGRYIAGQSYSIVKDGNEVAAFTSQAQVDAFLEAKGASAIGYEVLDERGDRVKEFAKPLQDNELPVYVNGQRVRIQLKDETLAAQMRPLDQKQMNRVLEIFRDINQYLSRIYTAYSPTFIITNPLRDMQTGTINMLGNQGAGVAAGAWARYPAAMKALATYATTGKEPTGETGQMLKEYRMSGGKTGASHMSDLDEQGKTLKRLFDDAYGASGYLADGKPGKAALIAGRKMLLGMANVIEITNQATENGLRLALYMKLRDDGLSPGKAAQAAKNVTVNFDRKGKQTPVMSALFLFINPAIQGTSNAMRTLAKGENKEQAWAALAGLALLGAWAVGQGMEDDPDRWLGEGWDTRSKKLVMNIGGHKIVVPLSLEFAPFFAAGVALEEARRGAVTKTEATGRLLSSFIGAYIPFRGLFNYDSDNQPLDAVTSVVPTVLRPAVEAATNRNAFGSKIVPENEFTKDRPDNLKMNRNTKGSVYDSVAQTLAAGGEKLGAGRYENDLSKVSPEMLKHWWRTYTGGLGTFITDMAGLAKMAGEDASVIEMADVPVVKSFVKESGGQPIRSRFYDVTKEARKKDVEFKEAKKAGDDAAMDALEAPSQSTMRSIARSIKRAAELRDEMVDVNADKSLGLADKRAKLKELEKEEESVYRDALENFR